MSNKIDLGKSFLTEKNVTIKDNGQYKCLKLQNAQLFSSKKMVFVLESFFLLEDEKKSRLQANAIV